MNHPWSLSRLIAPVTAEAFLRDHWEREPLVVRRGHHGHYADLLTRDDLDRYLNGRNVMHPAVSVTNAQRKLGAADYTYASGLIDTARIFQLFADGSTLVFTGLEAALPPLAALCRAMEAEMSTRFQTNVYFTPGHAQGFRTHYDSHDVFVLQVHGTKHWKLYATQVPLPFRGQSFGDFPAEPGEVAQEFELEPGDMLYMPRGLMHAASTTSDTSMHITMGVLHTTWVEVLIEALARYATHDPELRQGLPPGYARQDFDRAAAEKTFRQLFARAAEGVDFEGAFEVFVDDIATTRAPLLQGQLQQVMRLAEINPETRAGVRPNLLYRTFRDERGITISCAGRDIALPLHAAETATAALTVESYVVKDLPGDLDDAGKVVLVRRLVREGFVRASF